MYYANSEWTGIAIDKITHLRTLPASLPYDPESRKFLKLKHPSFRILQHIQGFTCSLVDAPTLLKAQKIAEWYYTEWLKVNHFSKN